MTIAGEEDKRDLPLRQRLGHRIYFVASDIHIQDRAINLLLADGFERQADPIERPDDAAPVIGQHVLDQQRHQHLVFDDKNTQTADLRDTRHSSTVARLGLHGVGAQRRVQHGAYAFSGKIDLD